MPREGLAASFSAEARTGPPVEVVRVGAFTIPTSSPESDGTLEWRSTTLVVVELTAGGAVGLGYTYAHAAAAELIGEPLTEVVRGRNAWDIERLNREMFARLRNVGQRGLGAMAVSAVDVALWDAKAKSLGVALADLLGRQRDALPVYWSGGFTSYTERQLREEFESWAAAGIRRFKMKIGRDPPRDRERLRVARQVIGPDADLFIDANSAFTRAQALAVGTRAAEEFGVTWFEQPLSPDDVEGLRFLRERVPPGLEIVDGEYASCPADFRRFLEAEAVDVLMPDATRCGGLTGFQHAAILSETWDVPVSSHCAPALHVHVGCATAPLRHAEYFHDHVRIERQLFEGVPECVNGMLRPDFSQPGHGLSFRWQDAAQFGV